MTDYVLTGLVKRRAELAGEIEATHERLRRMIEDLEKLDSVILQFDPTHQVEAIRPKAFRPPPDWARQRQHPCPSTGQTTGRCPRYIKDHMVLLACGGPDAVSNMQLQTTVAAKAKDRWETKGRHR